MRFLIVFTLMFLPLFSAAKSKTKSKVQEVNFDGSDVDGVSRTPDGSYLQIKKNSNLLPLYKVRKKFDKKLKSSVDYL